MTINNTQNSSVKINESYINLNQEHNKSYIQIKNNDTLYEDYPTVTIRCKPSCQSCHKRISYKWRTKTWVNYCPHCKRYNCLLINPKQVYEGELTCENCDSDYCGACGHDKCANYYRHRNYQLRSL